MKRSRFAPSPTGPLHLGHAYAAWIAAERGDEMLLRIEDIDQSRARARWEDDIHTDLRWLGLYYPTPVMRQSERQAAYDAALDRLWQRGFLYPCTCTRADIAAAAAAPQEGAPLRGPDGVIYPGTCRHRPARTTARPRDVALRLNLDQVLEADAAPLTWREAEGAPSHENIADIQVGIGDIVVARKDFGSSYHLSVVVDDAAQKITEVTRGADLQEATAIHVLLQRLLDLPTPRYHHHALIRDPQTGQRLAKRDDARALRLYRAAGWKPEALLAYLKHHHTAPPLSPSQWNPLDPQNDIE